jgi:putative membrane protein
MMGLGLLLPIALVLILAYALGWLPQRRDQGAGRPRGRDAAEILRERYARGEIDREQFERMREDLRA